MLMARTLVYRAENDDGHDVLRWVDRQLIRLVCIFSRLVSQSSYDFIYSVRSLGNTTRMIRIVSDLPRI